MSQEKGGRGFNPSSIRNQNTEIILLEVALHGKLRKRLKECSNTLIEQLSH